jgi:hypothetical protein
MQMMLNTKGVPISYHFFEKLSLEIFHDELFTFITFQMAKISNAPAIAVDDPPPQKKNILVVGSPWCSVSLRPFSQSCPVPTGRQF